jgi:hypothetical protein
MSKLYNLIENQVNIVLRILMEDNETGQIQYGAWISGPKWVKPIIALITTIVFLVILLIFGLFLWNNGLHRVMPNVFAEINDNNSYENKYTQIVITLLALMLIF